MSDVPLGGNDPCVVMYMMYVIFSIVSGPCHMCARGTVSGDLPHSSLSSLAVIRRSAVRCDTSLVSTDSCCCEASFSGFGRCANPRPWAGSSARKSAVPLRTGDSRNSFCASSVGGLLIGEDGANPTREFGWGCVTGTLLGMVRPPPCGERIGRGLVPSGANTRLP